jgi:hypothetical protein
MRETGGFYVSRKVPIMRGMQQGGHFKYNVEEVMKLNSSSSIKWLSMRKKQPKRKPLHSKFPNAIERIWNSYLRGSVRPPLTCIIVGGIKKELEYINGRTR